MRTTGKYIISFLFVIVLVSVPKAALGDGVVPNLGGGDLGQFDIHHTGAKNFGISTSTTTEILANVINYALAIIGFLGVLGFIISGIMYLVSAGDEKGTEKAKTNIKYSVIGITVALIGYVIMYAISTLLGAGGADNGL